MANHTTLRPGLVRALGLTAALAAAGAPYRPQPYAVRVVYIIPADQQAWPETQRRATEWLEDMQWFFAGEMQRLGYAPKTFEVARDTHGSVVFHGIRSPMRRAEFGKDPVDNCKLLAKERGLRCASDVVVYFYESYGIIGGAVSGAGARGADRGPEARCS